MFAKAASVCSACIFIALVATPRLAYGFVIIADVSDTKLLKSGGLVLSLSKFAISVSMSLIAPFILLFLTHSPSIPSFTSSNKLLSNLR